ncbi:hypothetical protein BYT27DRAFT_7252738 [Phlegmacium glaucopus]|nr:hypothetical protein BYT27DRAFT_7252738 [Phlegmacium glaucopus]
MPTAFSGISRYRADYELSADAYNKLSRRRNANERGISFKTKSGDGFGSFGVLSIPSDVETLKPFSSDDIYYVGTNIISGEEATIELEPVKEHPQLEYESNYIVQGPR